MILITGASAGIGAACAEVFAASGKGLYLLARRGDRLQQLSERLQKAHWVRVHTAVVDVSDAESVERWFNESAKELQVVDVLVNNAGLALGLEPIQEGSEDDWEQMFATNVLGLLRMTRHLLPLFLAAKRGHVVHIGSVASRWAYAKGGVYSATKRAVSAITEGMRLDLVGTPIRVTEISPGMVETEFSEVRFRGDKARAKAVYEGVAALSPKDVADAVAWAVDRPAHVNVQELVLYPTAQASPTSLARNLPPKG